MKNTKIIKVVLSLFLALGLTTSSFAMEKHHDQKHHDNIKIEHKMHNQDHKHFVEDRVHHKKHHEHYANNNDLVTKCIGTGLCLALISAINS